jgi:hypothetical protein
MASVFVAGATGSVATENVPMDVPLVLWASAGARAFSVAEIFCVAPLMVMAAENFCGPVPNGGGTPGVLTVNCHCVPPGESTALLARLTLNVPLTSVVKD